MRLEMKVHITVLGSLHWIDAWTSSMNHPRKVNGKTFPATIVQVHLVNPPQPLVLEARVGPCGNAEAYTSQQHMLSLLHLASRQHLDHGKIRL